MSTQSKQKISDAGFDAYVKSYDADLSRGLKVSGEDKDYFARGRINWLAQQLRSLVFSSDTVLDYGCGTGSAVPLFFDLLGAKSVTGCDESGKIIETARSLYGSEKVRFVTNENYIPEENMDLVFANGVYHHIPPAQRAASLKIVHRSLRTGGLFAFWENNPWNPGTRLVMSRIPFDKDAITLSPPEALGLLRKNGFVPILTNYVFFFPFFLSWFRWLEPWLRYLPLGAQYLILCRKK